MRNHKYFWLVGVVAACVCLPAPSWAQVAPPLGVAAKPFVEFLKQFGVSPQVSRFGQRGKDRGVFQAQAQGLLGRAGPEKLHLRASCPRAEYTH